MIADNAKGEKGKKNDLISISESESLNVKINDVKKTERNKYICPEKDCDLIPKIISVHSETGKIVTQCPNNHIYDIDVEEYLKIIDEKMKRNIEPKERIKIGESYDYDTSNKGTLISDSGSGESKDANIIDEKNKDISNIIRAYNRLLLTQENQPDNYLHNQNLINLGNFILKENSRFFDDKTHLINLKNSMKKSNSNNPNAMGDNYQSEFDNIINKLKEEKEQEETVLYNLETEYGIYLKERYQDNNLCLALKGPKNEIKYKKLDDKGFEYISQIRFKNLIELNLSNNNIINISNLKNMLLPHLEALNLSKNQIADIEPVANLLSKNLHEIYLQHNQIEDITPLLNVKFPIQSLEILRIDNNKFDNNKFETIKNPNFQKLIEKYKNKIIYEAKDWSEFNNKYKCNIDKNDSKLDIGSRRDKNKDESIIIELFPLVVYPNEIKVLILDNNRIQDATLIGKMPLYKLETLDLSLNLISSIIFLKKLSNKCKTLKILYLHDNKINDITPLKNYNNGEEKKEKKEQNEQSGITIFKNLETLSLKNNCLNLKDRVTYDILDSFIKFDESFLDYKKEDMPEPPSKKVDNNENNEGPHTGEAAAANLYPLPAE